MLERRGRRPGTVPRCRRGCTRDGGMQDDPAGTSWLAEDTGGRGVIDALQPALSFDEPDRVAGNAGCDRYIGSVTREGDGISFGQLAVTGKTCPAP